MSGSKETVSAPSTSTAMTVARVERFASGLFRASRRPCARQRFIRPATLARRGCDAALGMSKLGGNGVLRVIFETLRMGVGCQARR